MKKRNISLLLFILLTGDITTLFFFCKDKTRLSISPPERQSGNVISMSSPRIKGQLKSPNVESDITSPEPAGHTMKGENGRDFDERMRHKEELIDVMIDEPEDYRPYLRIALQIQQESGIEASKKYYRRAADLFNKTNEYWDNCPVSRGTKILMDKYLRSGLSVADLGCGAGYQLYKIADRAGLIYAVDINPYSLEFSKKVRKQKKYDNIKYITCTEDNVMLPKNSVDIAFFRGSARYIFKTFDSDPNLFHVYHALKKDGILFIMQDEPHTQGKDIAKNLEKTSLFKLVEYVKMDKGYYFVMKKVEGVL